MLHTPALFVFSALCAHTGFEPFQLPTVALQGIPRQAFEAPASGGGSYEFKAARCLTDSERNAIRERIRGNQIALALAGVLPPQTEAERAKKIVLFGWPVRAVGEAAEQYGVHGISNFVDMDPDQGELQDHHCGQRTYDGHDGVDIYTWPMKVNWWNADAIHIVAAAPGIIVGKDDGNVDQICGGPGGPWNAVYVQHVDGSVAWYGHLKQNSLTTKSVGEHVIVGDFLGVMGSSGNSTGPHLHLEVYDWKGNLVEPFTGPCDVLAPLPLVFPPQPYYDPAVNRIQVGSAKFELGTCPAPSVTHEVDSVSKGDLVYFTTFYRDQLAELVSEYRILRPDGSVYTSWEHTISDPHYSSAWWWWSKFVPEAGPSGTWSFEVTYAGTVYSTSFEVL